eukprot:COSAG05_NODE_38_length_27626_cov_78.614306_6_plen_89_part_00
MYAGQRTVQRNVTYRCISTHTYIYIIRNFKNHAWLIFTYILCTHYGLYGNAPVRYIRTRVHEYEVNLASMVVLFCMLHFHQSDGPLQR